MNACFHCPLLACSFHMRLLDWTPCFCVRSIGQGAITANSEAFPQLREGLMRPMIRHVLEVAAMARFILASCGACEIRWAPDERGILLPSAHVPGEP